MEAGQEVQDEAQAQAEATEESPVENLEASPEARSESYMIDVSPEQNRHLRNTSGTGGDRGSFADGVFVGVGLGCIATFVIMWITVFFTPHLSGAVTYEGMLTVFIYPLIYLLAVGLIALTAGIVREFYTRKSSI